MARALLYKDIVFNESKPVVNVLLETNFTKEVRIAMQKGTEMAKHQTSFPIVVEIVDGEINFGVNGEVLNLKKGALIALDGGVSHDLQAIEDTIIRLTLTKYDETNRVKETAG